MEILNINIVEKDIIRWTISKLNELNLINILSTLFLYLTDNK